MSSCTSRITGYPGSFEASDYILKYLNNLTGMMVITQKYNVMVPMDNGANISIPELGLTFSAHPIWPNGIQLCSTTQSGITGQLVYGGYGSFEDLDGKEIKGSIVLLEFNSMDNWKNVVKLGAKGIIFIEPFDTNRIEAEKKFLLTPLNIPRLYVNIDTGSKLKQIALSNKVQINVKSSLTWQEIKGQNIIGILPGEVFSNEIIICSSHYDTWSVVPSLAPGAEDAISPSSLLEFARILAEQPPKRTVWFVFYSGHWQALAGAREFAEQYLFQNTTYSTGQKKIIMQLSFDLSSETDLVSWTNLGDMYMQAELSTPLGWDGFINLIFQKYVPALSKILNEDLSRSIINPITNTFVCTSEIFDSEPISMTGILSLSFITAQTLKLNWQTPLNSIEDIKWENIYKQLKIIFYFSSSLMNEDLQNNSILTGWKQPNRRIITGVGQDTGPGQAAFITLNGRVEEYDFSKGFYYPKPNALVEVYLSYCQEKEAIDVSAYSNRFNPYTHIYTKADGNGSFAIHGLSADSLFARYNVLGYVLDPNSSSIIYAPSLGLYGAGGGIYGGYQFMNVEFDRHPFFLNTIIFRADSIVFFDIINPLTLDVPTAGSHFYTSDAINLDTITSVSDFFSHSIPDFYGLVSYPENLGMVFISLNSTVELTLNTLTGVNFGILNNANQYNPTGVGVTSQTENIDAFQFVNDLFWINEYRLSILKNYHFSNPPAEEYHNFTKYYMQIASDELQVKNYSIAYHYIYIAWQNAVNAYREINRVSHDVVNASVIFYILIIPFAYVFERLVFASRGKKQLFIIISLLLSLTILAYFMHPGFKMASNIFISILGITITSLILPVQFIIAVSIISLLQLLRRRVLKVHYSDISRGSAFLASFSLGLSNMRRRNFRTILNLVTVILFTSALVSLTSFSLLSVIRSFSTSGQTMYGGMLLKQNLGLTPFSEKTISLLYTYLGDDSVIAVRSWVYPPPTGRQEWLSSWRAGMGSALGGGTTPPISIYGRNGTLTNIQGLLGLQPEEAKITNIDHYLIEGRWFMELDTFVVIINQDQQMQLNVSLGDTLNFIGLNLKIIGIIDNKIMDNVKDLDQRGLNPMDLSATPAGAASSFVPLSLKSCLLIPYSLASQYFNGRINSIAVKLDNQNKAEDIARKMISGSYSMLEIYIGYNEVVNIYRLTAGITFKGWETLIFPIAIACLTLFVTMLGSVQERLREIAIYSTIGLSPLHVSGLFLCEFTIYAILGTTLGYILGLVFINIFYFFQAVPQGFSVNFSSDATLFTLASSFLVVIGTALYPALKASRIVTPSLTRKWEIKIKPKGDNWEIPLPIKVLEDEVQGIMAYMYEFFKMYTARDVGIFRVMKISYEEIKLKELPAKVLKAEVSLAPWDSGVAQLVQLVAGKTGETEFTFSVILNRIRGRSQIWISKNPDFIRSIRSQLILWNSLGTTEKMQYAKRKIEPFGG